MSQEYYNNGETELKKGRDKYNLSLILTVPGWVVLCFFAVQFLVFLISWLLGSLKVPLTSINETILNSVVLSLVYLATLVLVIFLPRLFTNLKKFNLKNADIGWNRLPKWSDILLAPASLVIYFILSALAIFVISKIFPGFDINQAQDVGFGNLNTRFDYILAFISLVVVAPLAEETLFRGYLYGKLKQHFPVWLVIVVVSLTFGALHGSWNVAIDTFVLSVVLCVLREMTDSLWAPVLLHMAKNGLAFYFLFINPILLSRIGG